MNHESSQDHRLTEAGVREDLQRQPHLLMKLAENALIAAEKQLPENLSRKGWVRI